MKLFIALIISTFALMANPGQKVYKKYCASCHLIKPPMQQMHMQKLPLPKRKAMLEKMGMKAPPMVRVAQRIKTFYKDEQSFIHFVTDYIQNPSQEKGVCMLMAFKMFGVMPPVGKALSPKERLAVAKWLYNLKAPAMGCR